MTKETARPPPKIGQNSSSYGLESTMKTDSFRGKSTVERTWVARRPFKAPAGLGLHLACGPLRKRLKFTVENERFSPEAHSI